MIEERSKYSTDGFEELMEEQDKALGLDSGQTVIERTAQFNHQKHYPDSDLALPEDPNHPYRKLIEAQDQEDRKWESKEEYERYAKKYMRGESHSFLFKAGEKVPGTLLTILGPGFMNRYGRMTWKKVAVHCECGTDFLVAPRAVSYPPYTYSCGCVTKSRWNEIDYSGQTFKSSRSKREITILFREPSGGWVYACSCCAETGIVPPGLGMTFLAKIKRTAAQRCPNRPPDTDAESV